MLLLMFVCEKYICSSRCGVFFLLITFFLYGARCFPYLCFGYSVLLRLRKMRQKESYCNKLSHIM